MSSRTPDKEPQYRIESDEDGNIVLCNHGVPILSMPRDTAIKMALIMLKKCGVQIDEGESQPAPPPRRHMNG